VSLTFEHVFEAGTSGWTLLLLHGMGGDEHELVPLGRRLASGAALLSPRGGVMERTGARRFFRRDADGVPDVADLLARTEELADFVAAATAEYELDPERLVAFGHSNGANVALSMLLRRPGLLRAAGLLRPMLLDEPEPLPDLAGTDVLVAAGESDPYSPPERTERLVRMLRRTGAAVTEHTGAGTGHEISHADVLLSFRWLRELLGGG
jgi:predicted esterase